MTRTLSASLLAILGALSASCAENTVAIAPDAETVTVDDASTADASTADASTADAGAPGPVFPLAASAGGAVVAHPRIAVITFAADALEPTIARFHEALWSSSYVARAGEEYGVGPIAGLTHVRLSEAAPERIDDPGIQRWLADRFGPDEPLGPPDPSTLYAIYYPEGTTITYGDATSCTWDGYHREVEVGEVRVGYAVLPRCASTDPDITALERLTLVASHEYFEWMTDPFPLTARAWHMVVPDSAAWSLAFAAELGDLCAARSTRIVPDDLGFTVQSMWSNRASAEGRAPCQPTVLPVYAVPIPTLPDRIVLPRAVSGEILPAPDGVPGVVVAPGASVAIPLHVYADGETPERFTITPDEGGRFISSRGLTFALDRETVRADEDVSLTITAPSDFGEPTVVVLYMVAEGSSIYTRWPFIVAPAAGR